MIALIGIDIGTQGTKAALFTEAGECLAEAFEASKLLHPAPGAVEEDPERQVASVCATIRKCVKAAGIDAADVAGIGIDGQMAGVIGVGRDGRNVTPYDSWLDTRCAPYIRKMDDSAGEEIVARAGGPPSFNHGPKILWWKHERKRDYRNIVAFVQPGAYAAMRLCGLDGPQAYLDVTYLHFSGFADNAASCWDEELCRRFEVDPAKLPRIVRPESIVGELTSQATRRCGLRAGVPVVAGCGDTVASFLGCGATRAGIGVDVAGTASVFAATTAGFRPDVEERLLSCGQSAIPGLWHPYAYINGGGLNPEWFCREVAGATGRKAAVDLDAWNRLAEKIEPNDDLPMFVPHLGGRVSPAQPDLRGAWAGLTWDHGRGHLYRAVLEGVALEYALYQQRLRDLYGVSGMKELRITGGGQRSELWNAIKADALQVPLRRVARAEGAPLGVAMLAGWGTGVLKGLPQASRQWISLGHTTRPRRKWAEHYARRRARYATLLEHLDQAWKAGEKPCP
jgi:xylulokinase